jgi:D-alanine-D-alanine ligase
MSLRVAVVAGGPSSEAAVSRASAAAVLSSLERGGHRVTVLELDRDLSAQLGAGRFDVVFPVTHGPLGEDGCLQGLLEVLGLRYVGAGVLASALSASKPHAKALLRAAGLPVLDDVVVARGSDLAHASRQARQRLGAALCIKPASGGSAIGVGRVRASDPDPEVERALERAHAVDTAALVEPLIDGREVTCGVLEDETGEPQALPPTLILPKAADYYDFVSRYGSGGSEHRCPAPFDAPLIARVQAVAVAAHHILGVRDLCRVDFLVAEGPSDSAVTLLEVNTLPGMTSTSLFPEAAAIAGVSFEALCDRLVRRAFARLPREAPEVVPMPP